MAITTSAKTANVFSVEELFAERGGSCLRIPTYQREYKWSIEQVVALCKDISAAIAEKRCEYHIGTLILHKNGVWQDIIDGQQRLTSVCVLLNEPNIYRIKVESSNTNYAAFGKISEIDANRLCKGVREKGIDLNAIRLFLLKCTFVVITVDEIKEAFQLFDTQNGRGKPLTPDNLLKAYHFHEMTHAVDSEIDKLRQYELESAWEGINKGGELDGSREQRLRWLDGPLLPHLIGEHLFRLRRWCRGDDALRTRFDKTHLVEFKGITLGDGSGVPPCHAAAFLRQFFRRAYVRTGLCLDGLPSRLGSGRRDPRFLDPFQSIPQSIVNGEDFFLYILNCATAYRMLFGDIETEPLVDFRKFHLEYCLDDPGGWNVGNRYARHVFESLCLLLFDRFGLEGLMFHYRLLYRFSYWERSRNARLWYQSAGERFAPPAVCAVMASETFSELDDALSGLRSELDELCKEDGPRHLFKAGWDLVNGRIDL